MIAVSASSGGGAGIVNSVSLCVEDSVVSLSVLGCLVAGTLRLLRDSVSFGGLLSLLRFSWEEVESFDCGMSSSLRL